MSEEDKTLRENMARLSQMMAHAVPVEPIKKDDLRSDLQRVLNRHSAESGSNTPDFILAQYLTDSLEAYDRAAQERDRWYGEPHPRIRFKPND